MTILLRRLVNGVVNNNNDFNNKNKDSIIDNNNNNNIDLTTWLFRLANGLVKLQPCLAFLLTPLMLLLGKTFSLMMMMMMILVIMMMMMKRSNGDDLVAQVGGVGNCAFRRSNDGKPSQLLSHSVPLHSQ